MEKFVIVWEFIEEVTTTCEVRICSRAFDKINAF